MWRWEDDLTLSINHIYLHIYTYLQQKALAALGDGGGQACHEIRLSNKSFSEDAAKVMAEALSTLTNVRR